MTTPTVFGAAAAALAALAWTMLYEDDDPGKPGAFEFSLSTKTDVSGLRLVFDMMLDFFSVVELDNAGITSRCALDDAIRKSESTVILLLPTSSVFSISFPPMHQSRPWGATSRLDSITILFFLERRAVDIVDSRGRKS